MSGGEDSHVHQLVMELTDPTKVRLPPAAVVSCGRHLLPRPLRPVAASGGTPSQPSLSRAAAFPLVALPRRAPVQGALLPVSCGVWNGAECGGGTLLALVHVVHAWGVAVAAPLAANTAN